MDVASHRTESSNGLPSLGDQVKRKGSPSEDRREHVKRHRPPVSPAGSGRLESDRDHGNGRRHSDREKRHKSKKHHRSERRSSKSRSSSPIKQRMGSAVDVEAGEIDAGLSLNESRDRRRGDSRPRSGSHSTTHTNGLSRPLAGPSHQRALTPSKDRSEGRRSPLASGLGSSMMEELQKAHLRLKRQREEQASLEAAKEEEEQLDVSLGRARGRHSPIVWQNNRPDSRSGNTRSKEQSAHEIAKAELEEFQRQRSDDLNGPVAFKASPSPSGSEQGGTLVTYRSGSVSNEVAAVPARSRWQAIDDEQEKAAEEEHMRTLNQHEKQDLELQDKLQSETEESEDGDMSDFQRTRPPLYMLNSSRSVHEYERMNKISEGTYGVVHRARDITTGTVCALKQIKMDGEKEGFPLSSIREINILLSLRHKNIVDVSEVVVGHKMDDVYMVMEYMEHDLKALLQTMGRRLSIAEAKNLMQQLLEGVKFLHDNWVLHRDLKTSNILYNNRGQLKICDFGMARQFGSPLRPYTHNVVTLLYRSIELLLGQKTYSTAVDVWSLGCIMAELVTGEILFKGCKELEQIDAIFKIIGTPTQDSWPGFNKLPAVSQIKLPKYRPSLRKTIMDSCGFESDSLLTETGFDLLEKLLCMDPSRRISAEDALNHPWFRELPFPKTDHMMPTFAESKNRDGKVRAGKPTEISYDQFNGIFKR